MPRRPDLHGLTGAYALDALDGLELDRFEHHLAGCPSCEHEVRGFRETAARLAQAVALPPPPALRQRVLGAVTVTRQLPPPAPPAPPAPRSWLRPAAARPAAADGRGGWFPRLAAAVAAVAAAVAIALGVQQAATQHQLDQARAHNAAVAAVLAAPDARLVVRRAATGGVASVVTSASRHAVVVSTSGMPALTGGKVYELWFLSGGTARPAGLLPPGAAGRTAPLLASGVGHGDRLAVTIEPAGGTRQPTTKPILMVTLPT